MGCQPTVKTTTSTRHVVYSKGGSTNQGVSAIFVLTPDDLISLAPLLAQLRVTLVTENLSDQAEIWPFIETTQDGCTWTETTTQLLVGGSSATWISDDTTTTTDWWTAAPELFRGLRLGVKIRQTTGTNVEGATVQLVVDWELKS